MCSHKHGFANKFETAGSQIWIKNPGDRKKADRGSGEGGGGEGYRKPGLQPEFWITLKKSTFQ